MELGQKYDAEVAMITKNEACNICDTPLLPKTNPRVFAECLSISRQDLMQVKSKLKDKQPKNKNRSKEKSLL